MKESHVPFWGIKLAAPAFFKEEKLKKYMDQWKVRVGLEAIKKRQAIEYVNQNGIPNPKMERAHKQEIESYIENALQNEKARRMKDVYITDHQPK